jgi:hypothetical protein
VVRLAGVLGFALSLLAAGPVEAKPLAPYTVIQSKTATLGEDRQTGDLLVIDGRVEIRGVVRGYVFAVDSEVIVGPTAVLLKAVSLHGGAIQIADGAVLPGAIVLENAELEAAGVHVLKTQATTELNLGDTKISVQPSDLPKAKLDLMKLILPFDRFTPDVGARIEDLGAWSPGLGLELKREANPKEELVVGGLARLMLESAHVKGSFQRGYRGPRGTVLLTAVQLDSELTARAFWREIANIPESSVRFSVKTELGDGAHWFFRHKNRSCMLWQRGVWFLAAETRLGGEDASFGQERQFLMQVLSALRASNPVQRTAER